MAMVFEHPKRKQGTAAQVRKLAADREGVVAALSDAAAEIESLNARYDVPVLRTLAAEYRLLLSALKCVDPTRTDDGLIDQLNLIHDKLEFSLNTLKQLYAGLVARSRRSCPLDLHRTNQEALAAGPGAQ